MLILKHLILCALCFRERLNTEATESLCALCVDLLNLLGTEVFDYRPTALLCALARDMLLNRVLALTVVEKIP